MIKSEMSLWSLVYVSRVGLIFLLSTVALILIYCPDLIREGFVFANVDHLLFIASYAASKYFGSLLDLQTFPFGQGFGVFQYPALLNASWWIWDLTKSDQLTYLASMFVLFGGVLVYYLSLRPRGIFLAIVAAFGAGTMVFNNFLMADYFATAMPQTYFQIGVAYFGCATFLGFGSGSLRWPLLGIGSLSYAVFMDWPMAIFLIPFVVLSVSTALLTLGDTISLHVPNWRAKRWQVFALVIASAGIAMVVLPSIYAAYDSFTLMSLRLWEHAFASHEVKHSLLLWGGLVEWDSAVIFGLAGLLAAIYHILRDRSRLLVLSLGVVLIVCVLAFFDNDAVGPNVYWPLPALGYFERPILPLYAIFLAAAMEDAVSWLARRPWLSANSWLMFGAGCIMRPSSLLFLIGMAGGVAAFVGIAWAAWPDNLSRIVFRKPIQDRQAEEFVKGLSLAKSPWPLYSPYFYDGTRDQLVNNCPHINRYPNHYCLYMFDLHSAPNITEYQNLIDIKFRSVETEMVISILHFPPDHMHFSTLMKSFGIRYVAVDGHWPSAMRYISVFDQEVSLLDLGSVRPEDLSIQKVVRIPYVAQDAVANRIEHWAIVRDDTSFRENQNLSPVDLVDFGYSQGAVAVRARSKGNAVALLPFQFSNCLKLDNPGKTRVRLIGINGGQAALSFNEEADVTIRNDFRLFGDPQCRYRDFVEAFRIGLYPVKTMEEMTAGYRVPLLMRWYLASRIHKRDWLLGQSNK